MEHDKQFYCTYCNEEIEMFRVPNNYVWLHSETQENQCGDNEGYALPEGIGK